MPSKRLLQLWTLDPSIYVWSCMSCLSYAMTKWCSVIVNTGQRAVRGKPRVSSVSSIWFHASYRVFLSLTRLITAVGTVSASRGFMKWSMRWWVPRSRWRLSQSGRESDMGRPVFRETDPNSLFSRVCFYTLRCYTKVTWGQQSWLLLKSGASHKCIQRS